VSGSGRHLKAFLRYLWYEFAYWLTLGGMTLGFSLRVQGRQNIPRTGPVLLIANHQSYLDPPLIGVASPRHLRYLARKTLFRHWYFAALIRSLNAVPIDQDGVGKEGLKTILRQLEAGDAVVVFPEGSRTEDGRMTELRPGILLLIKRVQAPIVPIGIAGAHAAWPPSRLLPIPAPLFLPATDRTLAISVGRPLDGAHYAALSREEALAELFAALQREQENAERLRRK
jgi:1-acyl-sn-glycerol-3-phosphate acyltransferase